MLPSFPKPEEDPCQYRPEKKSKRREEKQTSLNLVHSDQEAVYNPLEIVDLIISVQDHVVELL